MSALAPCGGAGTRFRPVTGGAGSLGSHCVRTLPGPDGPPGVALTVRTTE